MTLLARLAGRCRRLGQVLRDPLRKPLPQMIREATDIARRTGAYPEWYFLTFVYRRDAGPYGEYLCPSQYEHLKVLRQGELHDLLEDKLSFHEHFSGTDCVLPRLLAHNDGNLFHVGDTVRDIGDGRGFAELIGELRASCANGSIFAKPIDGRQGRHCRRIDDKPADLDGLQAADREPAVPVPGDCGPASGAGGDLPSLREHHPGRHLYATGRAARRAALLRWRGRQLLTAGGVGSQTG